MANTNGSKLTPKQEGFARSFVETGNASEAYRRNYSADNMSNEAVWVEACRTLAIPKVSLMVHQLQQEHAKRHEVTVDSLTDELNEAIELAKKVEQPNAIVSAVKEKGVLHGKRVEKSEQTIVDPHEERLDRVRQKLNGRDSDPVTH